MNYLDAKLELRTRTPSVRLGYMAAEFVALGCLAAVLVYLFA